MTVAALPSSVAYAENGVTTAFAAPFRFKSASDLVVERIAGGIAAPLLLGVDYAVTGGTTDTGGTVTRTVATSGAILRIRRRTARAQAMVYTSGDRFPAKSHEGALDLAMLIDQEQDDGIADVTGRALLAPVGTVPPALPAAATLAGKVLAVSADGLTIVPLPLGSAGPVDVLALLADPAVAPALIALPKPGGGSTSLAALYTGMPLYASLLGIGSSTTADLTATIQAFLNLCVTLGRQGVWDVAYVRFTALTAPGGLRLAVRAGCELRCIAAPAVVDATICITIGGDNVEIVGETAGKWIVSAAADDGRRYAVGRAEATSDVAIRGLRSRRMKHAIAGNALSYAAATGTNGPQRWRVSDGECEFDAIPAALTSGFVAFFYARSCSAQDMIARKVPMGVQAWGGDANPAGDGAIANARKCDDIQFRNIRTYESGACFVFASMVKNGGAWNCYGEDAADVGFDVEGCGDGTGQGFAFHDCHGRNAANGLYSTFFLNRGGGFFNSLGHQEDATKPLLVAVNPTGSPDNRDLIVVNPRFSAGNNAIGVVNIYSAVGHIVFQGGSFWNVRLSLNANNHFRARVSGLVVELPIAAASATAGIEVGGFNGTNAFATIANCRVSSLVAQPAGSAAVKFTHNDFNNNTGGTVKDCELDGFPTDVLLVDASANIGQHGLWKVLRNELGAKTVTLTSNGHTGSAWIGAGSNHGLYDGAAV